MLNARSLKEKLEEIWDTVCRSWKDNYNKEFERDNMSEMRDLIEQADRELIALESDYNDYSSKLSDLDQKITEYEKTVEN